MIFKKHLNKVDIQENLILLIRDNVKIYKCCN